MASWISEVMDMLPKNLKKLRLDLGLTMGGCADGMGVSRQTIYRLETGAVEKDATYLFYELYLKDVKRKRDYARFRAAC